MSQRPAPASTDYHVEWQARGVHLLSGCRRLAYWRSPNWSQYFSTRAGHAWNEPRSVLRGCDRWPESDAHGWGTCTTGVRPSWTLVLSLCIREPTIISGT